jgi:hypothetical protein
MGDEMIKTEKLFPAVALAASILMAVPSQPISAVPEGFEVSNFITDLDRPTNTEFAADA